MDFTRSDGFWSSPFPSDDRVVDGTVDLAGFPNPAAKPFVDTVLQIAEELPAFGQTSAIDFTLDGAIDTADLPDVFSTDGPVFLLDLSNGERHPIDASFMPDGGPFGAPEMLALLPLQGVPLWPSTRYAAVVTRDLHDADGDRLGVSEGMAYLAAGKPPEGMSDLAFAEYDTALDTVSAAGVPREEIAGITVFTTGDPDWKLAPLREAVMARKPTPAPFVLDDVFPGYCVYRSTANMPVFQAGTPPYLDPEDGGGIAFVDGVPVYQHDEEAAVYVTIPRTPMPTAGWPVVVMIPTGGGTDRAIVDRGVHTVAHGEAEPGTGPAQEFAAVGYAGASIDGPHGGLRNITHGDQQFLLFNITNPVAMLDNLRQSAAEASIAPAILDTVTIDVTGCEGATAPDGIGRLDLAAPVLLGHSMGATIAPTAAALEPRYSALMLSGAGGSWIANIVYKKSPIDVRPVAEAMIGYTTIDRTIDEFDPVLSLVQWAGEDVDPPVHAPALTDRDVLVFQGIVDTYILPPMANALNLSLAADLGGPALDATEPRLADFRHYADMEPLVGASSIALPAQGNRGGLTRVVVQHAEDGIEDGHEVMFQTEAPKRQYRTFLDTLRDGTPVVPQ